MLHAVLQLPGQPPVRTELKDEPVVIGRASQCDLALPESSLSRRHAMLRPVEGGWLLEDLGSHNGTLLRGERLTGPVPLRVGEVAELGRARLWLDERVVEPTRVVLTPSSAGAISLRIPSGKLLQVSSISAGHATEALAAVRDLTLDLLRDISPDELFGKLLDRLDPLLHPARAAVLLGRGGAPMQPALVRGGPGELQIPEPAFGGATRAAEAVLVKLPDGVALAAPLEHDGNIEGYLYLEAGPRSGVWGEGALRLAGALANVAAAKLQHERLARRSREMVQLEREVAIAREIQERLLPTAPPVWPGWSLLGHNQPSRTVSGDLFNFLPAPGGRHYLVVADVSGKGIGPALLMATLEASLAAWAEQGLPPDRLAARLSAQIAPRAGLGRFITAFIGLLDPATGNFDYCNAGHNQPLLLRASGDAVQLPPGGTPLALLPDRDYRAGRLQLAPGDLLLMYTDGLSEAMDANDEQYGEARITDHLRATRDLPLREIVDRLLDHVDAFTGGAPPHDDRTLLLLRRESA